MVTIKHYIKSNGIGKDLLSSIVVFLVALPLCLGISIASGVPPIYGLISGIIGGIIVGYFSGCPLQVSGPAAGLIAVVFEIVNQHGIEQLGIMVFSAGIIQIAFGCMKLGQWFRAVTPSVIHGMLAGIGILIITSQLHVMIDDLPKENGLANIISIPSAVYKTFFLQTDGSTHHLAAFIGIVTLGILVLWKFVPKKLKIVPNAIVAAIVGISICCAILKLPIKHIIPPSNLLQDLHFFSLNKVLFLFDWHVTISVLGIAFIASAETLLTATAITHMRSGLKTNYNKEIIAQGIGNTIAGLLGILPITGVMVRSATNVQAGAVSRLSTILHGIFILLFILFMPYVLVRIPTASLAAILVYTGFKMLRLGVIKDLMRFGKSEVVIYVITIISIVCFSLLEGILIGLVLSVGKLVHSLTNIEITKIKESGKDKINVYIKGSASFTNLPRITEVIENIPHGMEIHIHTKNINYIDHACIEFLNNWSKSYESHDGKVVIEWDELFSLATNSNKSKKAFVGMEG